jgi:hypothetical protein
MKQLRYIITALAALLALAGCQQPEQDVEARAVATSENLLIFEAQGAAPQTVKVYADGTWAVDTPNEWIHVEPMSGKGMGEVTVTVSDNVSGGVVDMPRAGSILIQGGTVERRGSITVKQQGDTYKGVQELTVKEVIALDDDIVAKIPSAQVAAVTKGGFVLTQDGENLYVQGARDVKVGDMVSLNGSKGTFNKCPTFYVDELTVLSSGTMTYPEAPDITAQIASFTGGSIPYVTLQGSLVNGALKVGPASVVVVDPVDELGLEAVDLHKVVLTGYAVGVNGATGYLVATKVEDKGADETLVPYPLRWAIGKDLNYSNATFNNDHPRIDPVQGIGYIEYVPYDLENTDLSGNYKLDVQANNPRVTGPWVNDYWLFYGNGAILAGTEVQISFEMRSSAWGMKFWLLEYLDGDEWHAAGTPQTSTEPGYEVQYTVATNPDGSTNVPVMETIRFRRNNEHLQIRLRCSALWRGGGGVTSSRSTASSRLSITNVDDDTYRPSVIVLKEGNGVEKDPVYADIQVDPELLTFNGTPGAPKTLTVTSDYDWTISTAYDWLHLDVEGGVAGEETAVTVTCDESELPELREGTIRIVSEDSEKVVHVVQSAAGQMLDPFISVVGGNEKEVGYEAGNAVIRVQGNVPVECVSDAPWMTVAPAGTRALVEWTEFVVAYEENTAEQTPRTGTIRFYNTEKKLESVLTLTQAGAPASGVYFQDDFEWLEPWAEYTVDDVANNNVGSSPNAFTKAEVAGALAELQNRGYGYVWGWKDQDWSDGLPDNGNKQTLYFMHNYLKFGKTSYNSGIILPALTKMTGTENVDLTFDWCWCMTGASKPDIMTLTVTVSGGGYLADTGTEVSGEIQSAQPTEGDLTVLEWQHAKVTVVGATPSTRITIRPTNADPSITSTRKQNRWYLDNIRVEKSDYVPQVKEFFADDFEWLEPWAAYTIDDVANNSVGSSPNVFTKAEVAGALAEFQTRGYGYVWGWKGQDWSDGLPDNGNKQTLYLMHNYLKFGKTSYNSGIILPALTGISGTEDVELTFDWCWCMTGASKPDVMTLTVTVSGGGKLADTGTEVSGNIESAQPTEGDQTRLEWQHAKVKILGATPSTRITIRPTNADPEVTSTRKQNRWYLDNIRVVEG